MDVVEVADFSDLEQIESESGETSMADEVSAK